VYPIDIPAPLVLRKEVTYRLIVMV